MVETRAPETVSTRLERIAKLAKDKHGVAMTTLAHHIDMEWLREAYRRTRKDGARASTDRARSILGFEASSQC
jgi:hypothetical protein